MSRLPVCSGAEAIRVFTQAGWQKDRRKGSHATLINPGSRVVLTIPLHSTLGPGLLRSLIRKAGLSVEEFVRLLKGR